MSSVICTEAEAAVEKGLQLLDERFGSDFVGQVNLDDLNIGSGISCVLGQCFGGYQQGLKELGIDVEEAVKYGFEASRYGGPRSYDALTEAWNQALLARSA